MYFKAWPYPSLLFTTKVHGFVAKVWVSYFRVFQFQMPVVSGIESFFLFMVIHLPLKVDLKTRNSVSDEQDIVIGFLPMQLKIIAELPRNGYKGAECSSVRVGGCRPSHFS